MSKNLFSKCPVCHTAAIDEIMQVKDYTVSGESFTIAECNSCRLRITKDAPGAATIAAYYKSENYISHTDTVQGVINRLYHYVRKTTVVQKRRLIEKTTQIKAGIILDVGSGTGAFPNEMKKNGWTTTGLEPDPDARKLASVLYNLELDDSSQLYELPAGHFDAITLWHVLEHVHDLEAYVQQVKRLLKATGKIFIAVPNYTSIDAAIYQQYWAAYDVPRHLYHFSPLSMQVLAEKHGLKIVQYKPMWFDSFYISLLSSKYKNGKARWLSAVWNGFRSNLAALGDRKKCSSVIYVIARQ